MKDLPLARDVSRVKLKTRSLLSFLTLLFAWLITVAPASGRTPSGYLQDPPQYSPEQVAANRAELVGRMRVFLARNFANYELMLPELERLQQSNPPQTEAEAQEQHLLLSSLYFAAITNIGMMDMAKVDADELVRRVPEPENLIYALLGGFRASARQGRPPESAERYVVLARQQLANHRGNPILEFAVRTAEYRLRKLKGYRPSSSEVLAEFKRAWAPLESYTPWTDPSVDLAWIEGRRAGRDWIDELAESPEALAQAVAPLGDLLLETLRSPTPLKLEARLSGDEAIARSEETLAFYALRLGCLDLVTYLTEVTPQVLRPENLMAFSQSLQNEVLDFEKLPWELGLRMPELPPYDLSSMGLLVELRARGHYLWARSAPASTVEKAERLYTAAKLAYEEQDPEFAVRYLLLCGQALSELGLSDDAITCWEKCLELADKVLLRRQSLAAATALAKEYERRGDWKKASHYGQLAAEKLEALAPLLGARGAQGEAMVRANQEVTEIAVKSALAEENPEKALAALTRGQQVQSATAQMEGQPEARAEALAVQQKEAQVAALGQQVEQLQAMPASPGRDSSLAEAQSLLADTRADFLVDTRRLRQKFSSIYGRVLRFDPLDLPSVQKTLPADAAVLQFFPTDDELYLFVVTQQTLRLRQVKVGRQALDRSILSYVRAIRRAQPGDSSVANEASALYGALIAPVAQDIKDCQTLILLPTGRLNVLPFASLTGPDGQPLGQAKRLLQLAKSSDLHRMASEKPRSIKSLAAFANATGDLPAASKEGEAIAALFPESKLFEGPKATREALLQHGADADALHVATHGEWQLDDSLNNYLSMALDQRVSQEEIFELSLDRTSLVILSACNTAMGDGGDASYVASLAEAFWIAGSQSVIASLWAVNDQSTSILMTEFYKALKSGDSKAESLRKAQAAVRAIPEFSHPYHWAGFVLFGDWR